MVGLEGKVTEPQVDFYELRIERLELRANLTFKWGGGVAYVRTYPAAKGLWRTFRDRKRMASVGKTANPRV